MRICFVGSGSKGNAVLIFSESSAIQIDMGLTLKRVKEGLKHFGKTFTDIKGVFVTHDHSDHIRGLNLYHGKLPLYAGEGTLDIVTSSYERLESGVGVEIDDITIIPFSVSHDAANPMNFVILADGKKLGYVTDTGLLDDMALSLLKNCDYYYFESNHDLKMLMTSKRPLCLKKRIHSEHGHLSNIDSANYLSELIGPKTKKLFLAHISEECNTPELAVSSQKKRLCELGVDVSRFEIIPVPQWEPLFMEEEA